MREVNKETAAQKDVTLKKVILLDSEGKITDRPIDEHTSVCLIVANTTSYGSSIRVEGDMTFDTEAHALSVAFELLRIIKDTLGEDVGYASLFTKILSHAVKAGALDQSALMASILQDTVPKVRR